MCIAFAVTSCSKEDNHCDPNDEESPCYAGPSGGVTDDQLLLIEFKVNGKTYLTYQYNAQNLLTAVRFSEAGGGYDLTRDNSGRLTTLDLINAEGLVIREDYTYDGTGDKPVSGKMHHPNSDDWWITIQYSYSQNTTTETFINKEGEKLATSTYTFNAKGNILIQDITDYATGQRNVIEQSDYDDKNGNFASFVSPWKISAVNNAQAIKSSLTDQIYKYTYNDAGYPAKAEVYNRGSDVVVQIHEYVYKKAN